MAAAAVVDPVSVPTSLGARTVIDVNNPVLDLQKLGDPQVSVHQCAGRYGPQAIRSLFEKIAQRDEVAGFTEVNLADNNIGDDGVTSLQKGLTGSKNLKTLLLPRAGFGAKGFQALGPLLAASPSLTTLVLSSNICGAEGVEGDFAKGLAENTSLRSLVLAACRLGDAGVAHLCSGPLQRHPTLEHVCLTYNRLEAKTADSVNQMLAVNQALRYLDLCGNSLGPEGAEKLVEGLKLNKGRLQKLGLAQNGIRLQGAKALSTFFMSPDGSSIDFMDLRHNNVTYHGVVDIRENLLEKPMEGSEGWLLLFNDGERQLALNAH